VSLSKAERPAMGLRAALVRFHGSPGNPPTCHSQPQAVRRAKPGHWNFLMTMAVCRIVPMHPARWSLKANDGRASLGTEQWES
jgi:hypothetical protein